MSNLHKLIPSVILLMATAGCSGLVSKSLPADAALVILPTSGGGADLLNSRTGAVAVHLSQSEAYQPENYTSRLYSPFYLWLENKGAVTNGVDPTGRKFMKLQTMLGGGFHEDLAITLTPQGCGYVNRSMEIVIQGSYLECVDFSEGLAAILQQIDGRPAWGFIDKTGKLLIPPKYYKVRGFSDGMAAVQDYKSSQWGFVDRTGSLVIPQIYADPGDFENGIVRVIKDNKSLYLDKSGKELTHLGQGWTSFSEERAVKSRTSLMDTKGNLIPTPNFESVVIEIRTSMNTAFTTLGSSFHEGLMRVHPDGGKDFVLMDRSGKFVTGEKFNIERIAPGFWYAQNKDGTAEVLQSEGKPIKTPSPHCRPLEHEYDGRGHVNNRRGLLICVEGDLPVAERFRRVFPEVMPRGNYQAFYFSVYGWQSPKFSY